MMRSLIARNPVRQGLFKILLIDLAFALNLLGVFYANARKGEAPADAWMPTAVLLAVGLVLLLGRHHEVCGEMDLALPIPARRLWLAHLAAVLGLGWSLLVVTVGLVLAGDRLLAARLDVHAAAGGLGPGDVAALAGWITLLAVGLAAAAAGRASIRARTPGRILAGVAVVAGMGLLQAGPVSMGVWILPAALAASCLIVSLRLRSLPPVFEAPIVRSAAPAKNDGDARTALKPAGIWATRLRLLMVAYRCTWKGPSTPLLVLPLMAAFTSLVGGALAPIDDEEILRFTMIIMSAYLACAFIIPQTGRFFMLDALPIGRGLMLAALILPSLLAMTAGYAGGRLYAQKCDTPGQDVEYVEIDGHHHVRVPVEYCEFGGSGEIPPATAPWGESRDVWRDRVVRSPAVWIHSPYSTPAGSSRAFVAWQLSRAIEAVYGVEIPADEISERFLVEDANGDVRPRHPGQTPASAFPQLRRRGEGPLFPVLLLCISVLWSAGLSFYFGRIRLGMSIKARKLRLSAVLGILLLLHLAQYVLDMTGYWELRWLPGLWKYSIRSLTDAVPGGPAMIWLLCLAGLGLCWNRLLAVFRKLEFPAKDERIGLTMIDA